MVDQKEMTGARALVRALAAQGVDHVFCVPGESYLSVLDALMDEPGIRLITCRHESGAANMAEAYGKLTGKPGICMVTRGPGATNASIGVHTAQQDSTPMILFVGQINTAERGRGAFQEVDYPATIGGLAKWSVELDDPTRVEEMVHRAFATAMQGRPGPVLIALPENMLAASIPAPQALPPVTACAAGLDRETASSIVDRLSQARRPILLLGGAGWNDAALSALTQWTDAAELPVVLSFRRKDLWDNDHRCYIGDLGLGTNPKLLEQVRSADLILALGARLGENVTQGYTLFSRDEMAARLIHILPDPSELGRVWPSSMAAVADVASAARALSSLPIAGRWPEWRDAGRKEYERFSSPVPVTGQVNLSEVFSNLRDIMPEDAIICNGAGNYASWLHRFYRHRRFHTQLAPTSGAMGYGVPAAIAAKLLHPSREVISVSGDGCFLMTGQEIATAVQHDASVLFLIIDNGSYGTIRMHQEISFPGRTIGTDLHNPDFAMFARAFGAWAATVETTSDFAPALAEARTCGRPAVLHVKVSVEDISPGKTIAQLRRS